MSFEPIPDEPVFGPEEVQRILRELPPLSRRVLELRCSEKLTYDEIAQELALPVGSVRKYMRGALFTASLIARGMVDK
jgi:DNA-directed RNA polymerase specialized sigma24 family protein